MTLDNRNGNRIQWRGTRPPVGTRVDSSRATARGGLGPLWASLIPFPDSIGRSANIISLRTNAYLHKDNT